MKLAYQASAAEVERIRKVFLETGGNRTETARRLGIHRDTVRRYTAGVESPVADEAEEVHPVEKAQKQARAKVDAREFKLAVEELAFRDLVKQVVAEAAEAIEPPPRYRPTKAPKGVVEESLVLNLSDWHAGEIVRAENVFGLNSYDKETTERRVRRIVASVLEIKARLESGGYRFPTLVIASNGDMVSGTIHEVERHTDGPNIMQTALWCGRLLAEAVRDLSAHFEVVHVFGTSGNHGRLGDAKKVQSKEPSRSWDFLINQYAAACLRDCENVTFEVPDAWAVMYELEGKLFYQGHGHFVKSWNSIPFYGITRMTSKLGATLSKFARPIDYWLFGHFHTFGSIENAGGEYLINPPLIGPQEFGIHSLGEATPPGQLLLGVHRKYGVTHRWRLHAEEAWPSQAGAIPTRLGSGAK